MGTSQKNVENEEENRIGIGRIRAKGVFELYKRSKLIIR